MLVSSAKRIGLDFWTCMKSKDENMLNYSYICSLSLSLYCWGKRDKLRILRIRAHKSKLQEDGKIKKLRSFVSTAYHIPLLGLLKTIG
jgi:hypothetical protein